MRPLIGVSACRKPFGAFNMINHAASETCIAAVCSVVGGVPVVFPACGDAADVPTLIERLDGILLTGSRSNVRPCEYGGPEPAEGTPEDPGRDRATLPLIRAAIAAGLPVLAICRGMQELNVALGGTLHQRLQDLPGRMDHSTPMQADARIRTGKAHEVTLTAGSWLHRLAGARTVAVNSLHNQGVDRVAPGLVVDALAVDGTIEAVHHATSPGFAAGVQWHPEFDWQADALSRCIFEAFGDAVRTRRLPAMAAAD